MNSQSEVDLAQIAADCWNAGADEFNQWDALGQDEKDELISKQKLIHQQDVLTPDQVKWASEQVWFEQSGEDAEGVFVIVRDSYGSRPSLVFRDFRNLAEWSARQQD